MGKGGKGKRKGSGYERKVCWALSRFIDPDGEDTIFWRSAMSGGRATVQGRKGIKNTNQAGDITCIDEKGQGFTDTFVIECKFYKDLDLASCLLFGTGKLAKFWKKHRKLAKKHGREPIMIAKQNRLPAFVIVSERAMSRLGALFGSVPNTKAITHALGKTTIFLDFKETFKPKATRSKR